MKGQSLFFTCMDPLVELTSFHYPLCICLSVSVIRVCLYALYNEYVAQCKAKKAYAMLSIQVLPETVTDDQISQRAEQGIS